MSKNLTDNLFALGGGRQIYTSYRFDEPSLPRLSASVVITTSANFVLGVDGKELSFAAAAIKPSLRRSLKAQDIGVVAFLFDPSHPLFPRFRRIYSPGVLPLPRASFDHLGRHLSAACDGTLTIEQADALFEGVLGEALRFLPRARPMDSRVAKSIQLLRGDMNYSLADLAEEVGVSYHRLSHLFVDNMGITLRGYLMWRKLQRAIALARTGAFTLTEAAHKCGFVDASHFYRAFVRVHAKPPSYYLRGESVNFFARDPIRKPMFGYAGLAASARTILERETAVQAG